MNSIGEKIKSARRLRGLTQKEIAGVVGCSEGQISYIESGNRNINPHALKIIEEVLEINLEHYPLRAEDPRIVSNADISRKLDIVIGLLRQN